MPITPDDVRLFASARMTDNEDGGGPMSTTVIVDGQKNSIFPDITDLDRLYGRCQLRKLHGAVQSADVSTYLGAHAIIDDAPDDAGTSAWLISTGGYTTERAAAVAAFEAWHRLPAAPLSPFYGAAAQAIGKGAVYTRWGNVNFPMPAVGDQVALIKRTDFMVDDKVDMRLVERRTITSVGQPISDGNVQVAVTFDRPIERDYMFDTLLAMRQDYCVIGVQLTEVRPYGVAQLMQAAAVGANALVISTHEVRAVPYSGSGAYPTENRGIDPAPFQYSQGKVAFIRRGDAVLVHDTQSLAPSAVANGQTRLAGRGNLVRMRVIGANGVEHARFVRGLPPPTGVGCTADLVAGSWSFSDVSGFSQPVTLEHRIEEMAVVTSVTVGANTAIGLNRNLSREYPIGAKVSSILFLGDLQARVTAGFAQQAWTGVFADQPIGGAPTGDFDQTGHPITVTNAGAVTERWACIFRNATEYRLVGEGLGEVGVGNTGNDYSPMNEVTGAPYLTIPAAGWSADMANGNVYRFNTIGAHAPLWLARTVEPSEPGGADSVTPELRGYINT